MGAFAGWVGGLVRGGLCLGLCVLAAFAVAQSAFESPAPQGGVTFLGSEWTKGAPAQFEERQHSEQRALFGTQSGWSTSVVQATQFGTEQVAGDARTSLPNEVGREVVSGCSSGDLVGDPGDTYAVTSVLPQRVSGGQWINAGVVQWLCSMQVQTAAAVAGTAGTGLYEISGLVSMGLVLLVGLVVSWAIYRRVRHFVMSAGQGGGSYHGEGARMAAREGRRGRRRGRRMA